MRLHRLQVTAFGPFAGTESVDFDLLDGAGLFLLTGATGAGKTSLLDAVCFALYGAVPGARGVKTLHCQHAPPGTRPEVELEFTVGGRRFLVRRSPEWTRPKRRGTGDVAEHASASLTELGDGTGAEGPERFLSSRAQEVGHLVGDLMGMTLSQFAQVAMLPQGEFQTFLRADSQDRHDVLEQLFKTDRFGRIEQWVHERSRALADQEVSRRGEVRRVLDTIVARAGTPLPEHLAGDRLAGASPDAVRTWGAQVVVSARTTLGDLCAACETAEERLQVVRADHAEATARAASARRRDAAQQDVEELAGSDGEASRVEVLLEADRRAALCLEPIGAADEAERLRTTSRQDRAVALERLAGWPEWPENATASVLTDAARELRERLTATATVRSRDVARERARTQLCEVEQRLQHAEKQLTDDERRLADLTDELSTSQQELAELAATGREADLERALQPARARHAAATEIPAATGREAELADAGRDARDAKATAQERLNALVARRLAGIAAELAGRLAEGRPCQVCGSSRHPSPAAPEPGAVTVADQSRAEDDLAACTTAHDSAMAAAAEAGRALAALHATASGADPETSGAEVAALERELAESVRAGARRESLDALVAGLVEEDRTLTARVHDTRTTIATQRQAADAHRQTVLAATEEIAEATGCVDPDRPVPQILAELTDALAVVDEITTVLAEAERAEQGYDDVLARATAAAHRQGFATIDAARAAVLPEGRRVELTRVHDQRGAALAAARRILAEPDVVALADLTTARALADETEHAAAVRVAEDAATAADRARHLHEDLTGALTSFVPLLESGLTAWRPARAEAERASAMALLVRGRGSDNHLQMRLSAFVLAARLDQVLDAANLRLSQMRDQRYLLARAQGRAGRSNARAGLDLEVLDQWTGESRAPTTLSGGETFVVSLSLALGLADVVTQEAGGAEIDTLFIDEGFGSLDEDTLEDVMDRLDGLRAGGRTVGVVSHVSELRERIPTQVRVDKTRTGSTVRVHSLLGAGDSLHS